MANRKAGPCRRSIFPRRQERRKGTWAGNPSGGPDRKVGVSQRAPGPHCRWLSAMTQDPVLGGPGKGRRRVREHPLERELPDPLVPAPLLPAITALPQAPQARGPREATAPPAPGCTQRPHPRRPPHARPAWSPPRAAPADLLPEPRAPSTCPRPTVDGPAVKQIHAVPPFPTRSPRSPLSYVSY